MTPKGLELVNNFLSDNEETRLLAWVDRAPWRQDLKRRVQHYGWRYNYRARRVDPSDYLGELPTWLGGVIARIDEKARFSEFPDQAIVNEDIPGQGIAPHVDCVPCFGPAVASPRLASCEMPCQLGEKDARQKRQKLHLPRGSLLVVSGPARYEWRHRILARKTDPNPDPPKPGRIPCSRRVSITFRTMLPS